MGYGADQAATPPFFRLRAGVAAAFPARPFSLVKVQALALRPEDADQLDRAVDDAEPVRCPRGELHGLAGLDS
jgi:hypothetical protein